MGTRAAVWGIALAGMVGCSEPPPNAACYIQPTAYRVGAAPPARMIVVNKQQWCSYASVKQFGAGEAYYEWGRVISTPPNGEVKPRMGAKGPAFDYRPKAGFLGEDSFEVEIGPGGGRRTILVTVRAPAP